MCFEMCKMRLSPAGQNTHTCICRRDFVELQLFGDATLQSGNAHNFTDSGEVEDWGLACTAVVVEWVPCALMTGEDSSEAGLTIIMYI